MTRDPNPLGDGWSLVIPDPVGLKAQCVDKFIRSEHVQSIILEVEVRAPYVEKTLSQLGYLHAAVYNEFYNFYRDQGIQVDTKEDREMVQDAIKYAVSFIVQVNDISGGVHYKPKSMATASKDEGSEYIDAVIRLGAEYGIIILGPEEYLEKHNAKEFE